MSAPVRAVCSMDMFVQAPVTMTVSTPSPWSIVSSRVPCQALMRIFSTIRSPSCGSSPSAGAPPQLPRARAFESLTPWNSGALSFSPAAPSSTMYQTWMTGTPARRHASARLFTFSTTPCAFACSGAPDSAKAPPSMITSFCRSWMISAVRLGSSCRDSFSLIGLSSFPDVGQRSRADLDLDPVERGRARHEHVLPPGAAPGEVADGLGHLDHAQVLALEADHPDAAGAGHPDVAALVALHPVRDSLLDDAAADALEEHPPVR